MIRKRFGRDKHQEKTRQDNLSEIGKALDRSNGFSTVIQLANITGLSRTTVYSLLKILEDSKKVVKDGSTYYTTPAFFAKLLEKDKLNFESSVKVFHVNANELSAFYRQDNVQSGRDYLRYRNNVKYPDLNVPFAALKDSEFLLWSIGTYIGVWDDSIEQEDLDLDVFLCIQKLIKLLIKKGDITTYDKLKMAVTIHFDIPTAIFRLHNQLPKGLPDWQYPTRLKEYVYAAQNLIKEAKGD